MNAPRELPPDSAGTAAAPRVLLVDFEASMAALIAEWLAADGWAADADASRPEPPAALILIDVAYPRQGGRERLAALQRTWPGVPVLVMSPTLLPGVSPQGEVARALGAAAVLPSPVSRESLRTAVFGLAPLRRPS